MKTSVIFILLIALAGCSGEVTFDASNDETIKTSTRKITASIPEEQREELRSAIMYFTIGGASGLGQLFGAALAGDAATDTFLASKLAQLDGLTGEQIIQKHKAAIEIEKSKAQAEARVDKLKDKAEKLLEDKKFEEAIAVYERMSVLPSGLSAAEAGVVAAKSQMQSFTEKMGYVGQIEITEFTAKRIDTYSDKGVPAVRLSVKNKGEKSLDKVEVTIYFEDMERNVIYEKDFRPVHVSKYNFGGDNEPLKAGYVRDMERSKWYTLDVDLPEWADGKASARVTDIEFSK